MRDNIAKFINNTATQITGESSNDGLNEYGFYYGKKYKCDGEYGDVVSFEEDGSISYYGSNGEFIVSFPNDIYYANDGIYYNGSDTPYWIPSPDGKTLNTSDGHKYEIIE